MSLIIFMLTMYMLMIYTPGNQLPPLPINQKIRKMIVPVLFAKFL